MHVCISLCAGVWACLCVHLHASWRSCPTSCVWAALVADSSPDLEVSSLEAQTHSNLWNTQFLSSECEERRGKIWWTWLVGPSSSLNRAFLNVIWSAHTYLILPWDGNTACSKFGVEVIVSLVQIYSLDCGELLYVQNILTVHCPRLGESNDRGKNRRGWEEKTGNKFILRK